MHVNRHCACLDPDQSGRTSLDVTRVVSFVDTHNDAKRSLFLSLEIFCVCFTTKMAREVFDAACLTTRSCHDNSFRVTISLVVWYYGASESHDTLKRASPGELASNKLIIMVVGIVFTFVLFKPIKTLIVPFTKERQWQIEQVNHQSRTW